MARATRERLAKDAERFGLPSHEPKGSCAFTSSGNCVNHDGPCGVCGARQSALPRSGLRLRQEAARDHAMSASLLEKVTRGPLERSPRFTYPQLKEVEGGLLKLHSMTYEDGAAVAYHLPIIERALATCRALLGIARNEGPGDHELLLQGLRFGFSVSAAWDTGQARIVDPLNHIHDVPLDAEGCPALTPGLRAALRAAPGLK